MRVNEVTARGCQNMGFAQLDNWRPYLSLLCCVILASCATRDPSSLANGTHEISVADAFVLPGDRSVAGIVQERASNAITQTVALSTDSTRPGENYLKTTFYGPVSSVGASENTLSYQSLTEGRISRELRTEMAGIQMSRSPFYVQNNYGPFSYATGTSAGGDTCIYAWQQIRSPDHTQNFFQNRGRIDIRLRLCETGASQEKLLAAMYNYTINATIADPGWNPYGEPASPSAALGRPGNPIFAPSVNSNMTGPFSANDLNSDRLNAAFLKSEAVTNPPKSAPAPRAIPANPQRQSQHMLDTAYPAVPQAEAVTRFPQAPIVPAPQQVNSVIPQPSNMLPAGHFTPTVQVPGPPVANRNASMAVVPSPCRPADTLSSGRDVRNVGTVCP